MFSLKRPLPARVTMSGVKVEDRRLLFACSLTGLLFISLLLVRSLYSSVHFPQRPRFYEPANHSSVQYAHFAPPAPSRLSDTVDTFANYKYREECGVSSLDLHLPFSPLCLDRASVLTAMSEGGRGGWDAPYIPRGCDMRWYSSEEVCDIISRFSQILIIGDSFMRHVANALWIYIRADIGYGGIDEALASRGGRPGEQLDRWPIRDSSTCRCYGQFHHKPCSMCLFWDTAHAIGNVSDSFVCKPGSFDLQYRDGHEWPLEQEALDEFTAGVPLAKPSKPFALIIDHSLHNDAILDITNQYIDRLTRHFKDTLPWLADNDSKLYMPRLYMSSSAGGYKKRLQPNQAMNSLGKFEQAVKPMVQRKGYDFLGCYNMSVQASSFDGTHSSM